jgi:hypothetical protein
LQKALTDAFILALEAPAKGRTEVADTRCVGLALRVTSNGAKSWSFRFRARGATSPSRVTLGVYPDIGLGKAREQAAAMRSAVATGGDPAQHKREEQILWIHRSLSLSPLFQRCRILVYQDVKCRLFQE